MAAAGQRCPVYMQLQPADAGRHFPHHVSDITVWQFNSVSEPDSFLYVSFAVQHDVALVMPHLMHQ